MVAKQKHEKRDGSQEVYVLVSAIGVPKGGKRKKDMKLFSNGISIG